MGSDFRSPCGAGLDPGCDMGLPGPDFTRTTLPSTGAYDSLRWLGDQTNGIFTVRDDRHDGVGLVITSLAATQLSDGRDTLKRTSFSG
jgi:hypothetical protein